MNQQNSQSPSWGAPVSGAWGSPLIGAGNGRNSPSNNQTPNRHNSNRDSANNSNSNRGSNQNSYSSPSRGHFNNYSPRHFQPRPRYQSSPLSQGGTPNQRFGYNHNLSQEFTPSPRHQGNNSFGSQRKQFHHREGSFNNPGGSTNINDYIHPSMLEDPWKDLRPMPLLRQY